MTGQRGKTETAPETNNGEEHSAAEDETTSKRAAALSATRDRNSQAQDKVEKAGADLTGVNALLSGSEKTPDKVERALDENERIEAAVQEASVELAAVNDALAIEIDERHRLEDQLSKSEASLYRSRTAERRARNDALHDSATGLPSLTLFNDHLANAIAQSARHGWRAAVLFIDLDEFKQVNDTFGHDTGDQVLKLVAERLLASVRGGDTASRRSGDEFLFLMLEAKDEANALAFATRLAQRLSAPVVIEGAEISVKASIGIAIYPEDGLTPADLLKNADVAMYAAKERKRGITLYGRMAPERH